MSAQILSLRGAPIPSEAAPNLMLVEELERLLQAARAGHVVGMAGVYRHKDKAIAYSYAGAVGGFALLGGLDCLKERLIRAAARE